MKIEISETSLHEFFKNVENSNNSKKKTNVAIKKTEKRKSRKPQKNLADGYLLPNHQYILQSSNSKMDPCQRTTCFSGQKSERIKKLKLKIKNL